MLTFTGQLLDVTTSQDGKSNNLVFEGESYDARLKRRVPRAFSVLVMLEHVHLIPVYRANISKMVSIPCEPRISKGGALWYATVGNGEFLVD